MLKIINISATIAYRVVSLSYYGAGLSPAGARARAGRFNPSGISALYLSMDAETAIAEYYGGAPPVPAAVLPVEVSAANVIDITGNIAGFPKRWRDWNTDWRSAREDASSEQPVSCPSWECGKEALQRNCSGILFPSLVKPDGKNLVVFPEIASAGSLSLQVQDPARAAERRNMW